MQQRARASFREPAKREAEVSTYEALVDLFDESPDH
jgi:hypothetical protein